MYSNNKDVNIVTWIYFAIPCNIPRDINTDILNDIFDSFALEYMYQ